MSLGTPRQPLADAEAWLDGLINRERQPRVSYSRFGLEAIEALLAGLGHPERGLSVVHLAGSKGKGSTALLCEALLRELGERVGTFTSPHLLRWTERFRIDGCEVDGEGLARAVDRVRPVAERLRAQSSLAPSFFDATTAAALVLFAEAGLDRVVLEVGLGGRLDSTNAVEPAVTCVTTIELEHTDKLGHSFEAIAAEKAGILKPGVPCVMGRLPPEAAAVVADRAARLASPLRRLGPDFRMERSGPPCDPGPPTPVRFRSADGLAFDAELAPPGRHQLDNAAVAVEAVRRLGVHPDGAVAAAATRALPRVHLPARIEVIEREPWVIVDAAHTRDSAAALREFLVSLGASRTHFVLSVSQDKALESILDELVPAGASGALAVTVTRAEPIRSLAPQAAASVLRARRPGISLEVEEDPVRAIEGARRDLSADTVLCITGSIYLAGIARRVLVPA